jgi:hypothetical protein
MDYVAVVNIKSYKPRTNLCFMPESTLEPPRCVIKSQMQRKNPRNVKKKMQNKRLAKVAPPNYNELN